MRNDHKAILGEIEQQLYRLHAEAREKGVVTQQQSSAPTRQSQVRSFAKITLVVEGSPAAEAVSNTHRHTHARTHMHMHARTHTHTHTHTYARTHIRTHTHTRTHTCTLLSLTQGLCSGDRLVEFGSVSADNFTGLQDISTIVQHSIHVGVV